MENFLKWMLLYDWKVKKVNFHKTAGINLDIMSEISLHFKFSLHKKKFLHNCLNHKMFYIYLTTIKLDKHFR